MPSLLELLPAHLKPWNTLLVTRGGEAYATAARHDPEGREALSALRAAYEQQADVLSRDLSGDVTAHEAAEQVLFNGGPDALDELIRSDPDSLRTLKQLQLQELQRRVRMADQALDALR